MFVEFLVALQFLTILRLRTALPFDDVILGRSGVFFPLVGLFLGAVVWVLDLSFSLVFPSSLSNVFLIVALGAFTRGLHLDGVADSADGLWGGGDRQRRLAIMKDSRIGAFGTLALLGIVLTKLRALDVLQGEGRGSTLLLSPMYGRWACVVMAALAVPAREEGLGAMFVRGVQLRELGLASAFTLLAGLYVVGVVNIVLFGVLAGLAIAFTRYCTRQLGGVTGDTLGAVGELVETAAFCLFAALASGGSRH